MEREGIKTEGILSKFKKLRISPIPLWKSFCAKQIPGPVELLRCISGGAITVEYIKIKTK
jgi:hypothetical protein